MFRSLPLLVVTALLVFASPAVGSGTEAPTEIGDRTLRPNVLVVTVDTLRADRVSAYGYERKTTPELDQLIAKGAMFTQARTVEPLTSPALSSMLTSLYPHHHGATRNGLRMRSGLASLPKSLQAWGYSTSAFVGNWTLRDKLSGMAEHFETYEEVLTRRRWFGLVRSEANAHDITGQALSWITQHAQDSSKQGTPFFTWVHYTEPHGPYRLHRDFLSALKIETDNLSASDRYDTEVAFVDASIGRLLRGVRNLSLSGETLIIFTADHGESLGEHGYWGHGRHLYEPTLRIPLALVWPGQIEPQIIDAPALNIDIASTVLGLLDHTVPSRFEGFDWTDVLQGAEAPRDRITRYEAHRGAVISRHDSELARRSGLLEVGVIHKDRKEIFRIAKNRSRSFDLANDPEELEDLSTLGAPGATSVARTEPSEGLMSWMKSVYDGLTAFSDSPPEPLDEESIEQLRSLGYVD